MLVHLLLRSTRLSVIALSFTLSFLIQSSAAQYLVNGQVYTEALAIVDAPNPNTTYHAGSNIPIAIDVSADGKLPQTAAVPGAGLATGFDLLELYLVSTQAAVNMTVSKGTGLLAQEQGSTVKHLNFALPNCVAAGAYNLTVYETSHINNTNFFSITPIPIAIENTNYDGPCTNGTNPLQSLPQPQSPPSQSPILNTTGLAPFDTSSVSGASSLSTIQPVTVSSSLLPTPNSTQAMTLTIGPSGVIFPLPTAASSDGNITVIVNGTLSNEPAPTVTVVLVTVYTATTTAPGQTSGFTTVVTSVVTSTSVIQTGSSDSGIIPVNSASLVYPSLSAILPALSILLMLLFRSCNDLLDWTLFLHSGGRKTLQDMLGDILDAMTTAKSSAARWQPKRNVCLLPAIRFPPGSRPRPEFNYNASIPPLHISAWTIHVDVGWDSSVDMPLSVVSVPSTSYTFPTPTELPGPSAIRPSLETSIPTITVFPATIGNVADAVQTSCCEPDVVVVKLRTAVTIPNYQEFYTTPIQSFQPTYVALPDGSLLASPAYQELRIAGTDLIIFGAYLLLSVRNICVSLGYIRRMKVKNKDVFYVLLVSQLFGPIPWVSLVISFYEQSVNCTTIIRLTSLATSVSTWLLLSGVLGIKAYRFSNKSRFVLIVILLIQLASAVLVALELVHEAAVRTLIGTCNLASRPNLLSMIMILIFVEAFFICSCFVYAVWKSSRLLAAQGRLTYRMSLDLDDNAGEDHRADPARASEGPGNESAPVERGASTPISRGWWDYIPPQTKAISANGGIENAKPSGYSQSVLRVPFGRFWVKATPTPPLPSTKAEHMVPPPPPLPLIARGLQVFRPKPSPCDGKRVTSPISTSSSRLKGFKPRMLLFREAMRDELCYTTVVTAICVVSAVLATAGISRNLIWSATSWFGFNWAVISILAIHSSGRVVRRHEQDALIHDRSLWDPKLRPDNDMPPANRPFNRRMRRNGSSRSFASDRSFLPHTETGASLEPEGSRPRSRASDEASVYSIS
ncbi:hypothetical protein BV25DRAFT_1896578 [Artomyces pyxidatus]|uniref:Uncharacterized protein n=1 Tax=Artomyces pyxidatus TaxID=48021 RepID=A0ACB8TJ49_9AGAM|nr:hypothetical protein BV25DRAFT_1896578 [Artomyces pyxidatus]